MGTACQFNYTHVYVRMYVHTYEQYGYAVTSPFPLGDLEFGPGTQLYAHSFVHSVIRGWTVVKTWGWTVRGSSTVVTAALWLPSKPMVLRM